MAPGIITPGGNGNLATHLTYNSFLALTSVVGPNGATATMQYDSAGRPMGGTSPHGAVTTILYTNSRGGLPVTQTITTGTRFTRHSFDGLGRVVKSETGYTSSLRGPKWCRALNQPAPISAACIVQVLRMKLRTLG